jgi:chromosomal replication initiator protein
MNPYSIPGMQRKEDIVLDYLTREHKVTREELVSESKKTQVVKTRREAMWIMRVELKMKLDDIAKIFNRDHPAVLKAVNKQNGFIKVYPKVKQEMDRVIKELKASI